MKLILSFLDLFIVASVGLLAHKYGPRDDAKPSAKVAPASSHRNPDFWRARGRNYLERYCYLVLFAAYALEHAPTNYAASFSEWAHHRWQLKRVLKHMTLEG